MVLAIKNLRKAKWVHAPRQNLAVGVAWVLRPGSTANRGYKCSFARRAHQQPHVLSTTCLTQALVPGAAMAIRSAARGLAEAEERRSNRGWLERAGRSLSANLIYTRRIVDCDVAL
jgi:hypothetical protein